jgi:hypothetical protein
LSGERFKLAWFQIYETKDSIDSCTSQETCDSVNCEFIAWNRSKDAFGVKVIPEAAYCTLNARMQRNRNIGKQEVLVKKWRMALDIMQKNVIMGWERTSRFPIRACMCARGRLNFKKFNPIGFFKGFAELGRERRPIYFLDNLIWSFLATVSTVA